MFVLLPGGVVVSDRFGSLLANMEMQTLILFSFAHGILCADLQESFLICSTLQFG